jgi:hypothetical protein
MYSMPAAPDRPQAELSTPAMLVRISHMVAGVGLVLAVPAGFRASRIHPVSAAARKPAGTSMPDAIIPRRGEKRGLGPDPGIRHPSPAAHRLARRVYWPGGGTCVPSRRRGVLARPGPNRTAMTSTL